MGGRRWAAEDFDHLQPGGREYRSHAEWLQLRLGFSPRSARVLSLYQEPLRKGRLRDWVSLEGWEMLVDVGCGVGYFLFDLAAAASGDQLLLGIDVSQSVLAALAARRRREGQKRILAVRGDAEQLPIRDATSGAVTSSEVLEHVADPDRAVAEMARVTVPGGVVVGTTPNARGEAGRDRIARWAERRRLIRRGRGSEIYWQELYDVPVHDTWLVDRLEQHGLKLEDLLYAHRVPGAARIAKSLPFGFTARVLRTVERLLPGRSMGMIMVFRARRQG
jgi:SAM-dependent methyltransferase